MPKNNATLNATQAEGFPVPYNRERMNISMMDKQTKRLSTAGGAGIKTPMSFIESRGDRQANVPYTAHA
jgi:hypothetical protein